MMQPVVTTFFDSETSTYSYVVRDPGSQSCVIIDSVLDYDPASGRTSTDSADKIVAFVREQNLTVLWLLETPCACRPPIGCALSSAAIRWATGNRCTYYDGAAGVC